MSSPTVKKNEVQHVLDLCFEVQHVLDLCFEVQCVLAGSDDRCQERLNEGRITEIRPKNTRYTPKNRQSADWIVFK